MFKKLIALILSLFMALGYTYSFSEDNEWICSNCGAANTTKFCTKCGAEKPNDIVCPNCGAKYSPNTENAFCGNCGTKIQSTSSFFIKYEGEGFASPEEALTRYMEGFKSLDFEKILSAFAWETLIEHYNLPLRLEYYGYTSSTIPGMPSLNNFLFSANVNNLRSKEAKYICYSLRNYMTGYDSQLDGLYVNFKNTEEVNDFIQKFEDIKLERFRQMNNFRFLSPDEVTDNLFTTNVKAFTRSSACYGADETIELIGIADVGEDIFYCCPTICRYEDKWYIVSIYSITNNIIGLSFENQAFVCGPSNIYESLHNFNANKIFN